MDDFEMAGWEDIAGSEQPADELGAAASPFAIQRPTALRQNIATAIRRPAPATRVPTPGQVAAIARSVSAAQVQAIARTESMRVAQELIAKWRASQPAGSLAPADSRQGRRILPLGLGSVLLNATSASGLILVTPQRALVGARLSVKVYRVGTTAANLPVFLDVFNLGDQPQLIGGGSVDVAAFDPQAVGTGLSLDAVNSNLQVRLQFSVTAGVLSGTDSIGVSASLIGEVDDR